MEVRFQEVFKAKKGLERIKVDKRKDALPKFLDKIKEVVEAADGKGGLEEYMRKALVIHSRLQELSTNIAQINESIHETAFTTRIGRVPTLAPAGTVAIVVDVRERGSCRVFDNMKYIGGADATSKQVVVIPWHSTLQYFCVEEVEMAYISMKSNDAYS